MTDEGDHGGAESLSHGLRSRWQLCCLTDAAYPLRVLRSRWQLCCLTDAAYPLRVLRSSE